MRFYKEDISIEIGLEDFIFLLEDDETDHILGIIEQLSEIDEGDDEALYRLGEEQGFKIVELNDINNDEYTKFVNELNNKLDSIFGNSNGSSEDEWESILDEYSLTDDFINKTSNKNKVNTQSKEEVLLQEIVEMFEHVLL